jgi:hypothetical protein
MHKRPRRAYFGIAASFGILRPKCIFDIPPYAISTFEQVKFSDTVDEMRILMANDLETRMY